MGVTQALLDIDQRSRWGNAKGLLQGVDIRINPAKHPFVGLAPKQAHQTEIPSQHREGLEQGVQSISAMLANEALVELAHWRALTIPCSTKVGQQHHTRSSQQVELLEQHLLRDAAESAQERLTQSQEGAVVEGSRLQIGEVGAQPCHSIVDNR